MKTLYLALIITTLYSCNAQNKKKTITNTVKQDTIMETFDIEIFNKNKEKDIYEYLLSDSTLVREQVYRNGDYTRIKNYKSSDFNEFYRFYPNGSLKIIGEFYENDFNSSIWTYYDNEENIEKTVDYDKPYIFSWEDIKKYLEEHEVEDIDEQVLSIRRYNEPEKTEYIRKGPYWELDFKGEYNNIKGQFFIELDGKTGEELLVKKFKGKGALGIDGTVAVYDTIYSKKEKN